jgi:hypothetical protein
MLELAFLDDFRDVFCKVFSDSEDAAVANRGVGAEESWNKG